MTNKLKAFWFYLTTTITAILGFIAYYSYRKDKEVKKLNDDIDLIKTDKEADLMEAEINRIKKEQETAEKMLKELEKAQEKVQQRRQAVTEEVKSMSPAEVVKYWENN